jgi:hypothetical protein
MAKIRLTGDTSGFTEVSSPSVAGNANIILPSGTGQANQFLRNTGTSGTLGWSNIVENATGLGVNTTNPDANLSVSGVASFSAGTSGTPSIASFGDLNTGIYFPSADTLAFVEGGNEIARVHNSGVLLVGTTTNTGTSVLQVNGDTLTTSINSGPLAGFRNAIINGNFDIWQRGTSFGSLLNGEYHSDRWRVLYGGGGTRTLSAEFFAPGQTDVPGDPVYFLKWNQTVAGSSQTANDLRQAVENVRTFNGQQVTLSFYAKAAASATLPNIFLIQNFGSGGATAVNNTIASNVALTTSWQRIAITTTLPSISGKAIGGSNLLDVVIRMPLNTTFNIDIAAVQLEPGPVATTFERRPIGTELALCQRYYELAGLNRSLFSGNVTSGEIYQTNIGFKVEKRGLPTVTLTNAGNAAFAATVGSVTVGIGGFQEDRTANATGRGGFISGWNASAEL